MVCEHGVPPSPSRTQWHTRATHANSVLGGIARCIMVCEHGVHPHPSKAQGSMRATQTNSDLVASPAAAWSASMAPPRPSPQEGRKAACVHIRLIQTWWHRPLHYGVRAWRPPPKEGSKAIFVQLRLIRTWWHRPLHYGVRSWCGCPKKKARQPTCNAD